MAELCVINYFFSEGEDLVVTSGYEQGGDEAEQGIYDTYIGTGGRVLEGQGV